MGEFLKYPHIVSLNKCPEILGVPEVVATEKLHGTSFRVFVPAGARKTEDIRFGSRNEELGPDANFYGNRPQQWFLDRPNLMQRLLGECAFVHTGEDVTIYGEIIGAGIQKGVRYIEGDGVEFRAFDVRVGTRLLDYDEFAVFCARVFLPRVSEIYRGAPSLNAFDKLLDLDSKEAICNGVVQDNNIAEGVVIRPTTMQQNAFGDWVMIKHKSAKFAETMKLPKGKSYQDTAGARLFAGTVVTTGRVANVLGHLRDDNVALVDDMADMKYLGAAMLADVQRECAAEWSATTARGFSDKQIHSAVTSVTANLYRTMLNQKVAACS